jgi:hypothetical protein
MADCARNVEQAVMVNALLGLLLKVWSINLTRLIELKRVKAKILIRGDELNGA